MLSNINTLHFFLFLKSSLKDMFIDLKKEGREGEGEREREMDPLLPIQSLTAD